MQCINLTTSSMLEVLLMCCWSLTYLFTSAVDGDALLDAAAAAVCGVEG